MTTSRCGCPGDEKLCSIKHGTGARTTTGTWWLSQPVADACRESYIYDEHVVFHHSTNDGMVTELQDHNGAAALEDAVVARARRAVETRQSERRSRRTGRLSAKEGATWVIAHWLAVINAINALLFLGTFLAPSLRTSGHDGSASILYGFYHLQCLQRPSHSFYLFGEKMGMEQRMVAMYGAWLSVGLAYGMRRNRFPTLPTVAFALASIPMGLDLVTQTAALSASNWFWRVSTGILFAGASAWWALSKMEAATRAAVAQSRNVIRPTSG